MNYTSHKSTICFLFRSFELLNQFVIFDEAKRICESVPGRRLAEPRNQVQFDALFALRFRSVAFYLGATDRAREGDWRWNTDNSRVDLTRFFSLNEPNGFPNEDCLQFRATGLNDFVCNNPSSFVCETGSIGAVPLCRV